ncbi:hypothetical protein FPANT_10757 [Fusarium pseudoanthophilum]|uniref:Uncharacterized protein n=1 Tax=Fusarium pseudoanthophilum TaxID=48495 RepID=A0A8H5KQ62_9HYPO|nr:hypothetical protein FPANT_10757 [Fusarium pseudoanthophilum]
MGSIIWDPADVLQVSDHGKCIGITTFQTRCAIPIKEPRLSAIGALLGRMSKISPEFATRQTLHQLADLCLCRYHPKQVQEFVSLWSTVIEEVVSVKRARKVKDMDAIKEAEQLFELSSCISKLRDSLDAASQENDQLQKQHRREVKRLRRKIKDLEQELQESKDHNAVAEQKSIDLEFNTEHVFRPKIVHLEQKLKESQERNNITEGKLSAMRTKLEDLQIQTTSDWLARNRLETENKSLKVDLIDAQKKLDEHTSMKEKCQDFQEQIESTKKKIKQCTVMLEDAEKRARQNEEKVATERAAKEVMERCHKAELAERESEVVGLKSHSEELEQTVAELQASIGMCWWHRLRDWTQGFWESYPSGFWISIPDVTDADIGLKKYA